MKRGKLLVMGQERVVWEDQVQNALEALKTAPGKNDRVLLRAIVEDWAARRMDEPMFAGEVKDSKLECYAAGVLSPDEKLAILRMNHELEKGCNRWGTLMDEEPNAHKFGNAKTDPRPLTDGTYDGAKIPVGSAELKMGQAQGTEGVAI